MGKGQSSSNTQKVDSNHQTFIVHIDDSKVKHPDFADLKPEFREKFSSDVWNQVLWTINDSVDIYKHNGSYYVWKSAYDSIATLKTVTCVFCFIPMSISIASLLILLFLLFISICLIAVGTQNSFALWNGTYNLLSTTYKYILIGCYLITFVAIVILYFTQKSLKPLQTSYVQNMSKYISSNLITLSKIYNTACFELKEIKVKKCSLNCRCGASGIELVALIKMSIFSEAVDAIDDMLVMDAFIGNAESSQSQNVDEFAGYRGYGYCRVNTNEGEPDSTEIQTDISIEIVVEE